jgi:hypothetical protein
VPAQDLIHNHSKGELMANAIPVHSEQKPKKQEKQPEQSTEQKPAEQTDTPQKGVPYKMPSGTICVDH